MIKFLVDLIPSASRTSSTTGETTRSPCSPSSPTLAELLYFANSMDLLNPATRVERGRLREKAETGRGRLREGEREREMDVAADLGFTRKWVNSNI